MKQAVILIHGIGEQVPMDTLRGFVDAVWTTDPTTMFKGGRPQLWSKPDRQSFDFELRRLTTNANREGRRTDFFEFYWAHLMEGTQVSHLLSWLQLLIFRNPGRVPPQLRGIWWFVVLSALLTIAAVVAFHYRGQETHGGYTAVAALAGSALWATAGSFVVKSVVGDAARYLHVSPPNIESRRRIREAGVALLHRLHTSGDYDRILVVGHSLGTVIGYDILTHYWSKRSDDFKPAADSSSTALRALEALARTPPTGEKEQPAYAADFQAGQSAYFDELKQVGHPWLVTDFVTMGSPLAHGVLLLARTPEEFQRKKTEREFPTCPPTLESILVGPGEYEPKFTFQRDAVFFPHHAAVFGPTRWTNLYFPCVATVRGDVVGGPVSPAFGPGVRDVKVETRQQGGFVTHTLYWSPSDEPAGNGHIAALRTAVRLCRTASPSPGMPAPDSK